MPGQDGTGPAGFGPRTGRGLGPCGAGARGALGRGLGRGFGRGLGWRCGCPLMQQTANVNLSAADEKKILEAELKEIEAEKSEITKRLKELK